ncbi:hypothetical protein HY382_01490 [Candidatus Curtissbacteria bacterium]|nr:hypothetical protein [Candidatus Curtissbacteria bacterium]
MVPKTVIKLIDEAIIPAILLISAKIFGLIGASLIFGLPFSIHGRKILAILPSVQFANFQDYIVAENYSNLAMFIAAAAGTMYILVKAHFFHESHIHPKLQAKLAKLNLESLITPSYHLYHQAAIWLTFLWLTVAFMFISSILKITYPQITIIAFIVAANFSWVFAIDVEKEIELSRET